MKTLILVVLSIVLSGISYAGEAVSGPNGKVGFFIGDLDGETGKNFEGSFSLPLGPNFGFQVDGLYTDVSDLDFYGLGAHLFWRDSEIGLLGVTGGAIRENDVLDSVSGGLEGEYYLDKFTFGAQGGVANIDYDIGPLPFIETDETGYYALAKVGYYPLDDVLLSLSYTHALDNGLVQSQIEYQTPFPGLSLLGELARGDNDYNHGLLGVRYYFGGKKSLILRHREDDPQNILNSILYTVGTYTSELNRKTEGFMASGSGGGSGPLPPPGSGGGVIIIGPPPSTDPRGSIGAGLAPPTSGGGPSSIGGSLVVGLP